MTNDRDRDRRLHELEPPAHRPGFWADVRAGIDPATSTRTGSERDARLVEHEDPVVLDGRRRPTAQRIWFAAAAVMLIALVGVAVAFDQGGDDTQNLTTDPTEAPGPEDPEDPADVTTAPSGPLRPEGDPIERGSGTVVAVDPAGRFLYVADDAPEGGTGCEGSPRRALFVEPIDGGERRQVLPLDLADATGRVEIRFGPDGEIAVHSQCEGYGTEIVTGTVGADGTVDDPTELTVPDAEGILDLEFRSAGLLVASTYLGREGTDPRHLYEFPVSPSEPTDLGPTDVVHLDVTADGRLATSSIDGTIRFDGDVVGQVSGILELAVSADGTRVFVAQSGSEGLSAFDTRSGERTAATGMTVTAMESVSSDQVVAITGEGPWAVRSLTFGDDVSDQLLLDAAQPLGLAVTADASRLFTQLSVSGDLIVVEQPLTR